MKVARTLSVRPATLTNSQKDCFYLLLKRGNNTTDNNEASWDLSSSERNRPITLFMTAFCT